MKTSKPRRSLFKLFFFKIIFGKNRTKNVPPKIEKGTNLACSIYSRINTGILRGFFRKNIHGNIREYFTVFRVKKECFGNIEQFQAQSVLCLISTSLEFRVWTTPSTLNGFSLLFQKHLAAMPRRRIDKLQCGGRDLNTGSCSSSCTNNHCIGIHANVLLCYLYVFTRKDIEVNNKPHDM